MPPGLELIGRKFGMLTVISMSHGESGRLWNCLCSCGKMKEKPLTGYELKSGKRNHCGCVPLPNGMRTHGKCETKLYKVWCSMKHRCSNPKDRAYANYGGRGIGFCDQWVCFEPFYAWAISSGYHEGLTLERMNNNGNYDPNNCAWIPKGDQSSNTRRCKQINFMGETLNLKEWSEKLSMSYSLLQSRLKHGWSFERAIQEPIIPAHLRHLSRADNTLRKATSIPTKVC